MLPSLPRTCGASLFAFSGPCHAFPQLGSFPMPLPGPLSTPMPLRLLTCLSPLQNTELKLKVDTAERERDFYFEKLRDIEILCQAPELQVGQAGSALACSCATSGKWGAGQGGGSNAAALPTSCAPSLPCPSALFN